jgi:D-alanyl-D-alanine dipeptidase
VDSSLNQPILITDPKILTIDIIDNAEEMIDIKDQAIITIGPSPEIPNNVDYTKMRKSVYEKLVYAQSLLPKGLKFCLYEAYRSLELQKMLFDTRYARLKKLHTAWSAEEIFNETTRLISPVVHFDGSINIPPHSTGAAIDVYLLDNNDNAVDMGIHPKDWMEDDDGSISLTASQIISAEARKNRDIMSAALFAAGFANYTAEYWHWSYGDRYWAYQLKQPCAIYGMYRE